MSSALLSQILPLNALVAVREENVKAAIGAVSKLPTFHEEFERLRAEVALENYNDIPMEFAQLQMGMDGYIHYYQGEGTPQSKVHNFTYTKHALAQAVSRIRPEGVVGMAGYLAACPPDLRSINFNYWHIDRYGAADETTKGNRVILRTKNGEFGTQFLRAVVSQSYVAIDDIPILSSLGAIIPNGSHLRSVRGDIRSRFDLVWPTNQHEIRPGDTLMVALRLTNSETGASSVRLEPMIYHATTSTCFIIPRAGEDVAIRHIGEAEDRLDKAFWHVMAQVEPFIEMLRESYSDSIFSHFPDVNVMWDALGKCFGISDAKMALVKLMTKPAGPDDRLDVASALVQTADNMDIESAEELQRAAGVLVMNGWRPLKKYMEE